MKTHAKATAIPMAERCADRLFQLAAAFPFLLLLALVVGLVTATPAKSREIVCAGKNLLTELATDDPAALEEVRRQAAETPNGSGLLWRVEKEGVEPSYLFGTMHMSDPRVVTLTEDAQAAFDASERVVIETTDILDQSKMAAAMFKRPELMMFTGDETLADHLSEEDREAVSQALAERGVKLHALATWWDALAAAEDCGYLAPAQVQEVRHFLQDPETWSAAHGGKETGASSG